MESAIAVVEPDGPVAVLRPGESGWARTELLPNGFWPAWNPKKAELAIAAFDTGHGDVSSAVNLCHEGSHLGTLFRQPPGSPPAIGPRIPG